MSAGQSIIEALDQIEGLRPGSEQPAQERLASIRASATRSLRPVRPLPSAGALAVVAMAIFLAFSLLIAFLLGLAGYRRLAPGQKLVYYAAILVSAALVASGVARDIIPGSKRRLSSGWLMLLAIGAPALAAFALFPRLDFVRFTQLGLPCLRSGTLCAAAAGFVAYPLLRKGFSTSPVRTAATAGLLAGLVGFAVLALHCTVQNIAHILVWHVSVLLIAAGAGALLARARAGAH